MAPKYIKRLLEKTDSYLSTTSDKMRSDVEMDECGMLGKKARRRAERHLRRMILMVEQGDTQGLSEGLREPEDLPEMCRSGEKAILLQKACECASSVDMVAVLIRSGAPINTMGSGDYAPLHLAARRGDLKLLALLLSHGANPQIATRTERKSPLHLAAMQTDPSLSRVLCQHGAISSATDIYDQTALHVAASMGHTDVIKVLLQIGSDPSVASRTGWTPLHAGAQAGHDPTVSILLENNAYPDKQTQYGRTPLHCAALAGHAKVVHMLLSIGSADTGVKDSHGRLAEDYANPALTGLIRAFNGKKEEPIPSSIGSHMTLQARDSLFTDAKRHKNTRTHGDTDSDFEDSDDGVIAHDNDKTSQLLVNMMPAEARAGQQIFKDLVKKADGQIEVLEDLMQTIEASFSSALQAAAGASSRRSSAATSNNKRRKSSSTTLYTPVLEEPIIEFNEEGSNIQEMLSRAMNVLSDLKNEFHTDSNNLRENLEGFVRKVQTRLSGRPLLQPHHYAAFMQAITTVLVARGVTTWQILDGIEPRLLERSDLLSHPHTSKGQNQTYLVHSALLCVMQSQARGGQHLLMYTMSHLKRCKALMEDDCTDVYKQFIKLITDNDLGFFGSALLFSLASKLEKDGPQLGLSLGLEEGRLDEMREQMRTDSLYHINMTILSEWKRGDCYQTDLLNFMQAAVDIGREDLLADVLPD